MRSTIAKYLRPHLLNYYTSECIHQISPVTMHRRGGLVHAPMNCTTFLCRTFLQVPSASFYTHTIFLNEITKQKSI